MGVEIAVLLVTIGPDPAVQLFNSLAILALTVFAGTVPLRTDPELLVETQGSAKSRPHLQATRFRPPRSC